MALDFQGIAAAALRAHETLLPQWIGGKRIGNEWVAEQRARGGPGDSWSINLTTGVWSHFASGISGHDIIGFYAQLNGLAQAEACAQIARQLGIGPEAAAPNQAPSPLEEDIPGAIPPNAPPIKSTFGVPTAIYRYGDALIVMRFDTPEGKTFRQWTWRRGQWAPRGYGEGCPLYRVAELEKTPTLPVLIVEGEKCVDMARSVLDNFLVTTWCGGAGAAKKSDWSALDGRDVTIWPDADEGGRKAAAAIAQRLHGIATCVRVINPNGADPGWDVADAIAAGWDRERINQWIAAHLTPEIQAPPKADPAVPKIAAAPKIPRIPKTAKVASTTPAGAPPSAVINWAEMGLDCDGNQRPFITLANASKILQSYKNFHGRIWHDEFRNRIYHTLRSTQPEPWTDRDTRAVTVAIQQQLQLPKFTLELVRQAITHAAECHPRHSLINWLDSLQWDGEPRLETWLSDCAGVEFNDYSRAVAVNWLIAMVARAYKPGCKMDNMPVLEGKSGLNKTQLLEILGGEWYEAVPTEFGTKDFLQNIQGVWLAEIPDMTGFSRADHSTVISMLTVRFDKYRKSYGYESERYPRSTIFAATSEDDDYVADARGKRRYWPIRCADINLDTLRNMREQLFAEAVQRYKAGAKWYEMPESAGSEQDARIIDDPWIEKILEYVTPRWEQLSKFDQPRRITMNEILSEALQLPPHQQGVRESRRAGAILKANGWRKNRVTDFRFWEKIRSRLSPVPGNPSGT